MRKVTAFALLLLVSLVLVFASMPACSCSDDDIEQPPLTSGSVVVTSGSAVPSTVVPDIRGKITSISVTSKTAVIMVEGETSKNDEIKYSKAWVTVDQNTAIGREDSSETVSHLSLIPGDVIEVWFSSTVAETDPVQAYAQAVKIMKKDNSSDSAGIINLPRLIVNCGADSSLAAITNVSWNGQAYNYGSASQVLESTIGSRVSVRCGETASLYFKMLPDSYTVSYAASSDAASIAVEPEEGRISFPKDAPGEYIYTVTASYGENIVTYVFSVFAFI